AGAHAGEDRFDVVGPVARQAHRAPGVAVHLDDPGGVVAGLQVEAVDVLRDQRVELALLLQPDERPMAVVGLTVDTDLTRDAGRPVALADLRLAYVVADVGGLLGVGVAGPE